MSGPDEMEVLVDRLRPWVRFHAEPLTVEADDMLPRGFYRVPLETPTVECSPGLMETMVEAVTEANRKMLECE